MMEHSFLSQTQKTTQPSPITNSLPSNITTYLLQDYAFLNEYQLLESPFNSEFQFMARIKATQQLVRFKKRELLPINTARGSFMYKRFQTLLALYQKGVILADNLFILQQAHSQHFYYVIEPYLQYNSTDSAFLTLQQYLFENRTILINNFQSRKSLFIKCKNLLDNLSLYDVEYCGLNSRRVVVDDQGDLFLLPFQLQTQIINNPYQRAYYPPEILSYLKSQSNVINSIQNWDLWSFGCITLDIFLFLTPCFLSNSIDSQYKKIKSQMANIFKDFQTQFLMHNNSHDSILQNQEQQLKDKQKILNLLINIFNDDVNKRQFSFESIHKEEQLLKSERPTSKKKSSIKRLLQKSKSKLAAKTQRTISLRNTGIESSRIFNSSSQASNFKELNICQKGRKKNYNIITSQNVYSFQIRLKTLILQTQPEFQSHAQLKMVINFANGQKFQFFTALPSLNSQKSQLYINRKITFLQRQQEFIEDLLEQDIQITLSLVDDSVQQEKQGEISINLSALMMKNEQGERLWKKPIKGTYQTEKDSLFQSKLKIEAEILVLCPTQNSLSKSKQSKIQMTQEKTERNFSIVQWLQDTDKITDNQIYQKKYTQQIQTSRFEAPILQLNLLQQQQSQSRTSYHLKNSIYDSSQINSDLHKISTQSRQKVSKQQDQQNQIQQQQIISTENLVKQAKIQKNINKETNQLKQGKTLQAKVKKILHQNRRTSKITEPIDLSKRLKRLLMR